MLERRSWYRGGGGWKTNVELRDLGASDKAAVGDRGGDGGNGVVETGDASWRRLLATGGFVGVGYGELAVGEVCVRCVCG